MIDSQRAIFPGTPEQILKGLVDYSLVEFLDAVAQEIRSAGLDGQDALDSQKYLVRVLDLAALGQTVDQIAIKYRENVSVLKDGISEAIDADIAQIDATLQSHQDKLLVLKALYHRMFALKLTQGSKEAAYKAFLADRNQLLLDHDIVD